MNIASPLSARTQRPGTGRLSRGFLDASSPDHWLTMDGFQARTDLADDVLQHVPALRIYARNLTHWGSEADDLVQETLTKAIKHHDHFREGTNLRAWLFTIMRNTFFSMAKKGTRERPGERDCASIYPTSHPTHDVHIAGQRLMKAIRELPDGYREAVTLVFLSGESYEAAAQIMGCSIGTVKSRISRARARLLVALGASDITDFVERRS